MNYYDKINWKNRSEGKTTKISAERLNHMDNQIFNNANAIGNVEKIADIGDGTLCGAAETLKETADKLTQSLSEMKHGCNIIGNVTGAYGSCNNLVCSCFVYNGVALCTIKMDSCKGIFDISLSSFGLPSGTTISRVNNSRLATNVIGANGQVLNINCLAGSTSLQIACSTTEDSYNFMFPVIIV